jgi:hypothetical protein
MNQWSKLSERGRFNAFCAAASDVLIWQIENCLNAKWGRELDSSNIYRAPPTWMTVLVSLTCLAGVQICLWALVGLQSFRGLTFPSLPSNTEVQVSLPSTPNWRSIRIKFEGVVVLHAAFETFGDGRLYGGHSSLAPFRTSQHPRVKASRLSNVMLSY